ncbi:MAG: hypothetical protein RIA69_01830 [Cyclobacteriaceae bacterium]
MTDDLNDLKNKWQGAKKSQSSQSMDVQEIMTLSKKKMKSAIVMHLKNIIILSITLVVLFLFFKYVAPLQEVLSQIGIALMIGGLVVRILIEFYSIYLSYQIDMSDTAMQNSNSSLEFFKFRKTIHGSVMYTILGLYTLGFYALTPEFSLYFSTIMMVLIDGSYLVIAVIVGYFINVGIKKEMKYLQELLTIQNDLHT